MHSCPDCGEACYCDMEDHENESAVDECVHACEPEPEEVDEMPYHQSGPCMQHGRMNCFDCNEEL